MATNRFRLVPSHISLDLYISLEFFVYIPDVNYSKSEGSGIEDNHYRQPFSLDFRPKKLDQSAIVAIYLCIIISKAKYSRIKKIYLQTLQSQHLVFFFGFRVQQLLFAPSQKEESRVDSVRCHTHYAEVMENEV